MSADLATSLPLVVLILAPLANRVSPRKPNRSTSRSQSAVEDVYSGHDVGTPARRTARQGLRERVDPVLEVRVADAGTGSGDPQCSPVCRGLPRAAQWEPAACRG